MACIQPSKAYGTISAPPSKSDMQRALAAALLRKGPTTISNVGKSNDDLAAMEIIGKLGAEIRLIDEGSMQIVSSFHPYSIRKDLHSLHAGESGLSLRMFTPIAALLRQEIKFTGEGSLMNRPISFFTSILPQLGVAVKTTDGKLPFTIQGSLQAKTIKIDGSASSQFLTGLLFAYSATNASGVNIYVDNPKSTPYIDMTLATLEAFGLKVPQHHNFQSFYFDKNERKPSSSALSYTVDGDWSNAAFFLVAGAIAGRVTIKDLDLFSVQGDRRILEALRSCGCSLHATEQEVTVEKAMLAPFQFDATDCPDLFPPLVVLAAHCQGISQISGVHRLATKESDRAFSLRSEFGKIGITIEVRDDVLFVTGGKIKAATVSSHNDHRIAMALAIAALTADGSIRINGAEAVNKSYPNFFDDLLRLQP